MDDVTLLAAGACAVLSALVFLMWRSAAKPEWHSFAQVERKEWRKEEAKRSEGRA